MTIDPPASAELPPALRRFRGLAQLPQLLAAGLTLEHVNSQLTARRWRRIGPSIVLHYRALTEDQQLQAARLGHGPTARLGGFTALQIQGLTGWATDDLHVVAAPGTPVFQHPELPPIVLHHCVHLGAGSGIENAALAAVRAADCLIDPRRACGLLASVVAQGISRPDQLRVELARWPEAGHRQALQYAAQDMSQDSDALHGLDLVRTCFRFGIQPPLLQQRRQTGQHRFLEAVWQAGDGTFVVLEVDGALQRAARRWWDTQLRPSDLTTTASGVLRVPSAVLRHEPALVLGVLTRRLDRHRAAG